MDSTTPLHAVLSDSILRSLAGEVYYQRGQDYFRRKLVISLEHSGNLIEATVSGTEDYTVRLSAQRKRFTHTCDCPIGDTGACCKHCVATALAWLAAAGSAPPHEPVQKAKKPPAKRTVTDADIRKILGAESKEALLDRLIDWSHDDKPLRLRITTLTRVIRDPLASVTQVRPQLEKAIYIKTFVEYRGAPAYAGRVHAALDAVELILRQGHATPVIAGAMAAGVMTLCEDAMDWLEASIGNVDDSDGQGSELRQRIAGLHLHACDMAKPDPVTLGARLFALEKKDPYGEFSDIRTSYAHLLGETGLAAYLAAAHKAWQDVPKRAIGDSPTNSGRHGGVTRIMESLARQSGDVEQIVAVLERNLTSIYHYSKIAEEYRRASRFDKALAWAERGLAIDPKNSRLSLLVAEEYQRAERHADALRLVWSEFRAQTSLQTYQLLESFARAAGDWEDPDAWRARALTHIRKATADQVAEERNQPDTWWNQARGHSLLVEIFLYEGKLDDAWHEAQTGKCTDNLWLELAAHRAETHPAEAFPIYRRIGEQLIERTTDGRYESAIVLLEKAAALMHGLGRTREFTLRFDTLRLRLKAKRNLQLLAEERRRFLYL